MKKAEIVRMIDPAVLARRVKASQILKTLEDAKALEGRRLASQLEKR